VGNINKAILMGRLTKDPELKYTTTTNMAVCNFTLAVNRRFAKEGQVSADFINIIT
jgi:single-strand DNA-binding protein